MIYTAGAISNRCGARPITAGLDHMNRRIVAFVGKHFPASSIDPAKLICYLISVMDSVVDRVRAAIACHMFEPSQDYVIVYFHTETTGDNRPELGLLRDFYDIVDNRHDAALWHHSHPAQIQAAHAPPVHCAPDVLVQGRAVVLLDLHRLRCSTSVDALAQLTDADIKSKIINIECVHDMFSTIARDQLRVPEFVFQFDLKVSCR